MYVTHLSLDEIRVDPDKNPRKGMDDKAIEELMASIVATRELSGTQKTLLQPITVRELPKSEATGKEKYELRLGYRRYEALRRLYEKTTAAHDYGWANRPECMVDDHDPDDETDHATQAFTLIENVQREAMTPIDEAQAIQRLITEHGLRQKDVVGLLGKSKGWVSQRLKLLKTAPEVQEALGQGTIGQAAGRQLARLEKKTDQKNLLELGEELGWSEEDWQGAVEQIMAGELDPKKALADHKTNAKEAAKAKEEPKPEEQPPSSDDGGTFSNVEWVIAREPAQVKRASEDLEFDHDTQKDDYARGALDALLWLVGLRDRAPGSKED